VTLEFRSASLTDVGRVREQNEDTPLADLPLVGVADGMGGHEGGEVASQLAVHTLRSWKERLEGRAGREASEVLREAFTEANRVVFEKGVEDESLLGMGTTLTIGWLDSGTLSLAHVGDSRAYLLRGERLQQLTEDQTVAQEWVRRGRLSEEEAAASPHRHILLQAIGADTDKLDIETTTVALRPGDRLLFASDGLTGMVKDNDQLRSLLGGYTDPGEACRALVDAANAAGGEDNISVVIVDVLGDADDVPADVDDQEIVVERGEPTPRDGGRDGGRRAPVDAKPRRRSRLLIALAATVVLLGLMAVFFVFRPASKAFVVAARGNAVVVLEGRPGRTESDEATGKVVHEFADVEVDDFPTTVQREFRAGIVVDSLIEANETVKRLRALSPPTPKPSPSPKPTKSPKPSPEETSEA
jgi:serine/threonine protein phosphatase PrpC